MSSADFMTIVRDYGIPTVLLVMILLEGRLLAKWIGSEVIKPVVVAHREFLVGMTTLQSHTNKILQELCKKIDDLARARESLTREITERFHHRQKEEGGQR